MTNGEIIRSLPLRDLASLIILREYEEDIDYDWDEEPFSWGIKTYLVTSDGTQFDEYDYDIALEHECWWLQQEAVVCAKENID